MGVKTNGSEFKRYYNDPDSWPKDAWHDDILIVVDGRELGDDAELNEIADHAIVEIQSGVVYTSEDDRDPVDMELHFKRWRKKQSVQTILVSIEVSKLDEFKVAIKQLGGKII